MTHTYRSWRALAESVDGSRRLLGVFTARPGDQYQQARRYWRVEYDAGVVRLERDREEVARG